MTLRITGQVGNQKFNQSVISANDAIKLFGLKFDTTRPVTFKLGRDRTTNMKGQVQASRGIIVLNHFTSVFLGQSVTVECYQSANVIPGTGGEKELRPRRHAVTDGLPSQTYDTKNNDDLVKAVFFALHKNCQNSPLRSQRDDIKFYRHDPESEAQQVIDRAEGRNKHFQLLSGDHYSSHIVRIAAEGIGIDTQRSSYTEVKAQLYRLSEENPKMFEDAFSSAEILALGALRRGVKTGAIAWSMTNGKVGLKMNEPLASAAGHPQTELLDGHFNNQGEAQKALLLNLMSQSHNLKLLTDMIRLADEGKNFTERRITPGESMMDLLSAPIPSAQQTASALAAGEKSRKTDPPKTDKDNAPENPEANTKVEDNSGNEGGETKDATGKAIPSFRDFAKT